MKVVALGVVLVGYIALVAGVNHVMGGCLPFKSLVWPSTSAVTDPCKGASTSTTSSKTTSSKTTAENVPPGSGGM